MLAIDVAAANDVMVFSRVRRSGLLYRMISSLAAVCELPIRGGVVGDQHLETRIRHKGPQPGFACRYLPPPMPDEPGAAAHREVGIFPFRIVRARCGCPSCRSATVETRGACPFVSSFQDATAVGICRPRAQTKESIVGPGDEKWVPGSRVQRTKRVGPAPRNND